MNQEPDLPVPQPDRQAYADNLRLALESSAKRRLNYLRLQERDRAELMDTLPAKLEWFDVVRAVALSLGLSFVVTIFPARRAARMNPVEALRYE